LFEPAKKVRYWRRWISILIVAFFVAAGGGGFYWWKQSQSKLPAGISWGNGRLEADEIDIDTKFAGRIAELHANIGDMVTAGTVVARMDTRDLQQSLEKSQAQVAQAQRAIEEANANLAQRGLRDKGTVRPAETSLGRCECGIDRRDGEGCGS
jgi:HlyD family secretion protein